MLAVPAAVLAIATALVHDVAEALFAHRSGSDADSALAQIEGRARPQSEARLTPPEA